MSNADSSSMIVLALQLGLVALGVWVLFKGGGPERTGAIILFCAFIGRGVIGLLGHPYNYDQTSIVQVSFAILLFLASLYLASQSNRIWPIAFASLYAVELMGFLSVFMVERASSYAFWIMTQVPIIAQTIILACATALHRKRSARGVHAADWRLKASQ